MKKLGYLFFFLMLVIPTTFPVARGVFLAFLLGVAFVSVLKNGIRLNSRILGLTFICVLTSLVFMTWGSLNGAPGALRVGTVYALWPLLYVFFIGAFYERKFWEPYLKIIVIASLVIEGMCLLLVTDGIGISSFGVINYIGFLNPLIGIYSGKIELNIPSISTLLFAVPYLLAKTLSPTETSDELIWKILEKVVLLGGIIVMFFIGRRALLLMVVTAPVIYAILWRLSGAKLQMKRFFVLGLIGIIAIVSAVSIYNIKAKTIWDSFSNGFDFNTNDPGISAYRRTEQFKALMAGWELNPLFGAGHGAAAQDNTYLTEEAWAYELSYIALLFQVGIVGLLIYTSAVLWLYYRTISLTRDNMNTRVIMVPVLTGLTAFLIGNSTNPYLAKFDYLWVIFLPIALLNSYLISSQRTEISLSNESIVT